MKALSKKMSEGMNVLDCKELKAKVASKTMHCVYNEVMYHSMDDESPTTI